MPDVMKKIRPSTLVLATRRILGSFLDSNELKHLAVTVIDRPADGWLEVSDFALAEIYEYVEEGVEPGDPSVGIAEDYEGMFLLREIDLARQGLRSCPDCDPDLGFVWSAEHTDACEELEAAGYDCDDQHYSRCPTCGGNGAVSQEPRKYESVVREGARWLDARKPSWDADVKLEILNMKECDRCILGQVLGTKMPEGGLSPGLQWGLGPEFVGVSDWNDPVMYGLGFNVEDEVDDGDEERLDAEYAALGAEWRRLIQARRYPDTV